MKGIYIDKQLEFRLEVTGDSFHQDDSLPCVLSVKNHAAAAQTVAGLRLDLALADLGKVKQKSEDAFKVIASAECEAPGEIASQEQKKCSWTFNLDKNCVISEKNHSLYLLFGGNDTPQPLGQALLTVAPHNHIQQILSVLESAFQFVQKSSKSSGDFVQVKFKPSTARKYSFVEELTLCFKFDEDALLLKYVFRVKQFDTTASSVSVKKGKNEVQQRLEKSEYMLTAEHVDHKFIEGKIDEALGVVSTAL